MLGAAPYCVELHLHTCFSFLDGASLPEALALRAADLGYRALAITDHDGLHGAMEFAQACAAAGVQPIVGVELTLAHGLVDERRDRKSTRLNSSHVRISYAVFCLKKKKKTKTPDSARKTPLCDPPNHGI